MSPAKDRTLPADVSVKEAAIVELASGTSPDQTAKMLGLDPGPVKILAQSFGWPKSIEALRSAANGIYGGIRTHRGSLPKDPAAKDVPAPAPVEVDLEQSAAIPADLDRVVDRQDELEAAAAARAADRPTIADRLLASMTWQDGPFTVTQAARVEALRSVQGIVGPGGPSALDLLDLADWVLTGARAVGAE